MKTQARAAKGGVVAKNGEYYEGGKFLPSTELPKSAPKKRTGTGKQEVAPYVWEVPAEEGARSLYRQFAGVFGVVRNGVAELRTDDRLTDTLVYYRTTLAGARKMIDDYNAGIRWIK